MPYLRQSQIGGGQSQNNSTQQYTFGIKKAKTGGFIGAEVGIGSAFASIPWRISGYAYGGSNYGYAVFPLNIFGGYQWYLYDQPHYTIGVRVRGHIGYTNYNATLGGAPDISLTSHGIQYGAEAQFVWDFLDYEAHTFGMHIALLGFEGSTFSGKGVENGLNSQKDLGSFGSHTKFAYSMGIGLHYYYAENHQVYLTHRYRTYSTFADSTTKYYSVANNVFSFGYAYKF